MITAALPFSLHPFGQHDREADEQLILVLANAQVPFDRRGNEEWLQHRRVYDERNGQRRHYIGRLVRELVKRRGACWNMELTL